MNVKKIVCCTVLAMSASFSLAGCGGSDPVDSVASDCKPAHDFTTVKKGTLTVTGTDLPPFGVVTNKTISGVDGDIIKAIAAKECLTIKAVPNSAAATIPSVQAGRADIAMGDWTRTVARSEIVDMTDPVYIDQLAMVSKDGASSVADLKGKRVGTINGYSWVDSLKALDGSVKIYKSNVEMYADLKLGRLDIAIDSFGAAKVSTKGTDMKVEVGESDPAVPETQEGSQTGFPVGKSADDLLAAFNANIAEMKADGSIAKILAKNGLPESAGDTGAPRLLK